MLTENDNHGGLAKAREDFISMIRGSQDDIDALVEIIENELKDMRDGGTAEQISRALDKVAEASKADTDSVSNLLYWLTETSPDARQKIILETLERMLKDDELREAGLMVLTRVSSKENVEIVMRYVEKNVLTLSQAIFVLLFPDSSLT